MYYFFIRPWFHIYGDNFVEIEAESNDTTYFGTPKHNNYDEYVVWMCMGVYLILTNILLLNIIIAVFNNTYVDVKNQGTKIWKFKRYEVNLSGCDSIYRKGLIGVRDCVNDIILAT